MEPEIYYGKVQVIADTVEGDVVCPLSLCQFPEKSQAATAWNIPVENVSVVTGWCCRFTMPGYLDSTEWSGPFETEEEAEEYLRSGMDLD